MDNLFVSYDIAVIAKDNGFNEPCMAYYSHGISVYTWDDDMNPCCNSDIGIYVARPTYHQLINWFKEREIYVLPFIQFENIYEGESNKELLEDIYYVFHLPTLRKDKIDILPYIKTCGDFSKGDLSDAIQEAFKLIERLKLDENYDVDQAFAFMNE